MLIFAICIYYNKEEKRWVKGVVMKRFLLNIPAFFLISLLLYTNLISVVEEGRPVEERAEREPQTKQEALDLQDRAFEDLKEARRELKEGKGDIRLLEIKEASANLDLANAQIFLTQDKLQTDPQNIQLQNRMTTLESSRDKFTTQLNELTQKLASEVNIPPPQQAQSYEQFLKDSIAQLPDTQKPAALLKEFYDIPIQYTDYDQQLKILTQLNDFVQQSNVNLKDEILDNVQGRIKTIQDALATGWKPGSQPTNPTGIEKANALWEKIPSDQIAIIKSIYDKTGKIVEGDLNNIEAATKKLYDPNQTDKTTARKELDNQIKKALGTLSSLNEAYMTLRNRNLLNTDAGRQLADQILAAENKVVSAALKNVTDQAQAIALLAEAGVDEATLKLNFAKLPALNETLIALNKSVSYIANNEVQAAVKGVQELVSNIKEPEPVELPIEAKPIDQDIKDIMDAIYEKKIDVQAKEPGFLDKLKNYARLTVDKVKSSIAATLERVGEKLVNKFSALRDVGQMTQEYTSIIQENQYTIKAVATSIGAAQESRFLNTAYASLQAVIKEPRLQAFLDAIKQVKPVVDFVADQKIVMDYVTGLAKRTGQLISGIGNAGVRLGTLIGGTERVKTLAQVKELETIVEKERINIYKKPLAMVEAASKFALQPAEDKVKAVTNVVTTINKMATDYINDLIYWFKGQDKYQAITSNLSTAQQQFIANPTPENAKNVVDVITQATNEYERLYNKLDIAAETLGFLVKAFDGFSFDEKADVKDVVQSFFDLRQLKASYLQTIRNGLDGLNSQVKQLTDPTANAIGQNYVNRLQNIIESQRLVDIINYAQVIEGLNAELNKRKEAIIKSSSGVAP